MDELKGLLKKVSDSYEDFVNAMCSLAKQYDEVDILSEYIKQNPDADSSNIVSFMMSGGVEMAE